MPCPFLVLSKISEETLILSSLVRRLPNRRLSDPSFRAAGPMLWWTLATPSGKKLNLKALRKANEAGAFFLSRSLLQTWLKVDSAPFFHLYLKRGWMLAFVSSVCLSKPPFRAPCRSLSPQLTPVPPTWKVEPEVTVKVPATSLWKPGDMTLPYSLFSG